MSAAEFRAWLLLLLAFVAGIFLGKPACAAPSGGVPPAAARYRVPLIQTVQAYCGLSCPTADFAAQIHQESRFRTEAKSPVGAVGMTQFMPATAKWISGIYPAQLGANQPADPVWAMRAMVLYDGWLMARVKGATPCDRAAKGKSAYNGGLGWVYRDEKTAAASGLDPARWWGNVERVNAGRSAAAWRENRDYPRLILTVHAPAYERAGWGRRVCA
jgi:hypothetical protein